MLILIDKFKFSFGFEDRNRSSGPPSSSSLRDFRSKISNFLAQILVRAKPPSDILSLRGISHYLELIHVINKAFAELLVAIDYPATLWGGDVTEQYLSYTLNLLDFLNAIDSAVAHINHAKVSNVHALKLLEKAHPSSAGHLIAKIPRKSFNLGKYVEEARSLAGIEEKSDSWEERIVLEALIAARRIGFLALALVLSGLCGDSKPYADVRKLVGGSEDSLIKSLDSIHGKEITEMDGLILEVMDVNAAGDHLSAAISAGGGRWGGAASALKESLEELEISLQAVQKQSSNLFSEILATRTELLGSLRLARHKF